MNSDQVLKNIAEEDMSFSIRFVNENSDDARLTKKMLLSV